MPLHDRFQHKAHQRLDLHKLTVVISGKFKLLTTQENRKSEELK
jgi:hypothetical protein